MTTTDNQEALRDAKDAYAKASLALGKAIAAVALAQLHADEGGLTATDREAFARKLDELKDRFDELEDRLFFAPSVLREQPKLGSKKKQKKELELQAFLERVVSNGVRRANGLPHTVALGVYDPQRKAMIYDAGTSARITERQSLTGAGGGLTATELVRVAATLADIQEQAEDLNEAVAALAFG